MMDKPWPRWAIWTGIATFLACLAVGIAGVVLRIAPSPLVIAGVVLVALPRLDEMWSEIRRVFRRAWRPGLYYLEELALWACAGVLWWLGHGWWALIPGLLAFAPTVRYAWRLARG